MGKWKQFRSNEQVIEGLSYLIGLNKKREARHEEVCAFMQELMDRVTRCEKMIKDLHKAYKQPECKTRKTKQRCKRCKCS